MNEPQTDVQEAVDLVLAFFKYDSDKTKLWFETDNELLGHMSPNEMIEVGREDKVLKFIKAQLRENSL